MVVPWRAQLEAQLGIEEGVRYKPYTDSKGKVTIGRGRNLTDRGISKDEEALLFKNDVDGALRDAATFTFWKQLSPTRQIAFADLVFNMGLPTLKTFTVFLRLMAAGQYIPAGHDLNTTLWAHEIQPSRVNRIVTQIITDANPAT